MASFDVSTLDILMVSLSAHACLLLRALLGKFVDWLLPRLSACSAKIRTLHRLHTWAPDLLPRMFSEQASLLVLAIFTLAALSHTSVSLIPFGHQPQPRPDFLIRVILCASTARYTVMLTWLLLGREAAGTRMKTEAEAKVTPSLTAGESGSRVWDFLYFIFCGGTTLLSLGYRQNLLLAMTLPFHELSSVFSRYCQLVDITAALETNRIRTCGAASGSVYRTPRGLTIVACVICFICRIALPALFLALAVQKESPLVMDRLPLIWFVLTSIFLSSFHLTLIYRRILSVTGRGNVRGYLAAVSVDGELTRRGMHEGTGGRPGLQPKNHVLSIHNHPDSLTNDIHHGIALEKQDVNKTYVGTLRDLNYGLLRPCDNRNISSCARVNPVDSHNIETKEASENRESEDTNQAMAADKINVLRKKDMSKTWLLYRLLANSLSTSPSLSTSSVTSSLPPEAVVSREDAWMFPALFDASSNTKLQRRICVESTKQDSQDIDKEDQFDKIQCHSENLYSLKNSEKNVYTARSEYRGRCDQ